MSDPSPIVEVRNICVDYRHSHAFFRKASKRALNEVSFNISEGETLGVIGRNGCGKSTLLRVLAGIYKEDEGVVIRRTNQISLLSLALGFDLELSGRDNAVICGMLLGHRKKEVISRLDEIIEFSELKSSIDDPIKTYSTGMRARLGFSVALSMQVRFLLIDEILGVGDVSFRKKAYAAMTDRISSGQTVVLVSHSIDQVNRLCNRVLWLEEGEAVELGDPEQVTGNYLAFMEDERRQVSL